MPSTTLETLHRAQAIVHRHQPPTPQYRWPLLCEALGTEVWVKHENHTATGAFKIRGGLTFMDWLRHTHPDCRGIVTATRGNHGHSQARAAKASGLTARVFVPVGNSREKNHAMRAFGATLIEGGRDFDEARLAAARYAEEQGLFFVPPFHAAIVHGVASYALELFAAVGDIDRVYVPIGCGSGICGLIAARDALGLRTEIVGVVSTEAAGAKLSFEAGRPISTDSAHTFADGMAVRDPVPEAFAVYREGASHVVAVSDGEVAAAIRLYFSATHNVAEGAGAASLAAAYQERERNKGLRIAVILCGANIDTEQFAAVLRGATPRA